MRRWPLLLALVACGPGGEWNATDAWFGSITLTPGAPEAWVQWSADAGVIVDDTVVDDTGDDGFDDEATLELRVTVDATVTGADGSVVRVLWWGEGPDDHVPPPEDLVLDGGADFRERGPWEGCDPDGCVIAGEQRFDLRSGDEVTVDVEVEVEARASDEDNPIVDGWLVVGGSAL